MELPNKDKRCHLTGFEKSCRQLVFDGHCTRWINAIGIHPQTGEHVNRWNCIDEHTPWLMIEHSKLLNQVGAAIESFRNEMVNANEKTLRLMQDAQTSRVTHTNGIKVIEQINDNKSL